MHGLNPAKTDHNGPGGLGPPGRPGDMEPRWAPGAGASAIVPMCVAASLRASVSLSETRRWHPRPGAGGTRRQAHVPSSGVSQRGCALGLPELAFLICERLRGAALLFGWVTVAVAVVTVLAGCRGWGARAGEAGPARVWRRWPGAA